MGDGLNIKEIRGLRQSGVLGLAATGVAGAGLGATATGLGWGWGVGCTTGLAATGCTTGCTTG